MQSPNYLEYKEQDRGVQVDHAHSLDISPGTSGKDLKQESQCHKGDRYHNTKVLPPPPPPHSSPPSPILHFDE